MAGPMSVLQWGGLLVDAMSRGIADRLRERVIAAIRPELDAAINDVVNELKITLADRMYQGAVEVLLTDNREKRG